MQGLLQARAAPGEEAPSPSPLCPLSQALWKLSWADSARRRGSSCSSVASGPPQECVWGEGSALCGEGAVSLLCRAAAAGSRHRHVHSTSCVPCPVSWSLALTLASRSGRRGRSRGRRSAGLQPLGASCRGSPAVPVGPLSRDPRAPAPAPARAWVPRAVSRCLSGWVRAGGPSAHLRGHLASFAFSGCWSRPGLPPGLGEAWDVQKVTVPLPWALVASLRSQAWVTHAGTLPQPCTHRSSGVSPGRALWGALAADPDVCCGFLLLPVLPLLARLFP